MHSRPNNAQGVAAQHHAGPRQFGNDTLFTQVLLQACPSVLILCVGMVLNLVRLYFRGVNVLGYNGDEMLICFNNCENFF